MQRETNYIYTPSAFHPRRLLLFGLLFVGLTALGVYAVYSQVPDSGLEWDSRLFSGRLLAGSVGLLLLYFAADGLRLWFTLRALGHSVRPVAMARLVFLNIFISNITPLATGGGVVQVWFLRRSGVPVGTGMTATTIRTALAVLFIFGSAPLLVLLMPNAEQAARSSSIVIPLLTSVALYLGGFAVLVFRPVWLLKPILGAVRILRRLHFISEARAQRWKRSITRELRRFSRGFGHYVRGRWYDILGSIVCTALFLLALFSFPALLFWALDYDFAYWVVIGRMLLTTFVMYFSPTPGASGIAEGVFGRFFADIVSSGHLVIVTVAWRALTIYLGMLIGLFVAQHEIAGSAKGEQE